MPRSAATVSTGRTMHTSTSPDSTATLAPNSVCIGATSRALASPTDAPNTTRGRAPRGVVIGSVIMKSMKMTTSGEVTTTHQKSAPQTGVTLQRAEMQ